MVVKLDDIYDHDCKLCPLHKIPGITCLSGIGNLKDPRILIVGDGPSKLESASGKAYKDARGGLLAQSLDEIGFPLGPDGEVFATYAVKCFPSGKVKVKDAKICAEKYLFQELDFYKPKLIITLGKIAQFMTLGSNTPISKTHGKLFTLTRTDAAGNEWSAQVMPVDHPFSILSSPAKLEPWLADLRRARMTFYSDGSPFWSPEKLEHFNFQVITSTNHFRAVAKELIDNHRGSYLAIDIEASGVDEDMNRDDFKVFSIQFGLVDLEDKAMNDTLPVYFLPIQSKQFDVGVGLHSMWQDKVVRLLNRFLSLDYFKLVGHNLKYDLKGLRRIGVDKAFAAYDTMMLWSVAHGEAPMSLKEIAYQVTELGGYEVLMNEYFKANDTFDAPPELLVPYACLDIVVTRHLFFEMHNTLMQQKKRVVL